MTPTTFSTNRPVNAACPEPSKLQPTARLEFKDALTEIISNIWLSIKRTFLSTQTRIQQEIDKVDLVENQPKPVLANALRTAFANTMKEIKQASLNPEKLPKQIAFQLTEIVGRFGMAIYANKDVADPFLSSLNTLKTAVLLQEYALGLSDTCPNLAVFETIDDIYVEPDREKADQAILGLDAQKWAAKTLLISQKQLLLIPKILRYIDGANGYLGISKPEVRENLLTTAEACLVAAQKKPSFDQPEINQQLAELKYNNMTGFLAGKIEDLKSKGLTAEAEEVKKALTLLWEECVSLSKDPEMMQARCDNKRTFIEDLSIEEEFKLRMSSLKKHLELPEHRQNKVLIALSFHNISHLFAKVGDLQAAIIHSMEAISFVRKARAAGENNVEFDSVINHMKALIDVYASSKSAG